MSDLATLTGRRPVRPQRSPCRCCSPARHRWQRANTSAFEAQVQVTVVFEDGTSEQQTYAVPGSSRFNVPMGEFFPSTTDKRFGMVVESLPTGTGIAQIIDERASYNDAVVSGQTIDWAAGANAFGTKLR